MLVVVGSLLLQWFAWFKRNPIVGEREREIQRILELETEVGLLENRWTDSQDRRALADQRLNRARNRLFLGDPLSPAWTTQIADSPEKSALTFTVQPGRPIEHPGYSEHLAILPTTWRVRQAPGEGSDLFQDLHAFLEQITTDQIKWMDLTELNISGNEVEPTHAHFQLRLWFHVEPEEEEAS